MVKQFELIKRFLGTLLFILIFATCAKDNTELPVNEIGLVIETVSHKNIGTGGVVLTGKIQNLTEVLDYGFVLTTFQGSTNTTTQNIEFNSGSPQGEYTSVITAGLVEGTTYYYNAVVRSNGKYFYGEEKSFVSNGSARPVIEKIEPQKACLSDTITINGKFFSDMPKVYFGPIESIPFMKSDSVIKCVVPVPSMDLLPLDPYENLKIINTSGQEKTSEQFSLHTPKIDSVLPRKVHDLDTLRIYGSYFDRAITSNTLTTEFEGITYSYEILEATRNKLLAKPMHLRELTPELRLNSQLQTIPIELEVLRPEITGLSKNCLSFGEDMTIYGTNFPVSEYEPVLKFGQTYIWPQIKTKDSIVFALGDQVYDDFEDNYISVIHLDQEIKGTDPVCISEPWLKIDRDTDLAYPSLTHYYNNEIFVFTKGWNFGSLENKLLRYKKGTREFEEVTENWVPEKLTQYFGTRNEFNNSKLYSYYFYTSGDDKFFSSYDIFTNEEEVLANFPGDDRDYGLMVSVGDYIYLGLGATYQNEYKTDIWRYSVTGDSWEQVLTDFPGIDSYETCKTRPMVFTLGDKIYIGSGQPVDSKLDFWELDTSTHQLTAKADMPIATSLYFKYQSTTIGNKAFFQNGSLYEYDSAQDLWKAHETNGETYQNAGYLNDNGIIYMMYDSDLYKLNPLYLQ